MISHPTYERACGTHFTLGEMAINNELRELIQIQSIKTLKTPSKDVKRQGACVAAFTSVITCK